MYGERIGWMDGWIDEQTKKYENSDTKKELIDKDETITRMFTFK